MTRKRMMLCVAGLMLMASTGFAQVGDPMPDVQFSGFTQTDATSIDDFKGRLILLEVFAYW